MWQVALLLNIFCRNEKLPYFYSGSFFIPNNMKITLQKDHSLGRKGDNIAVIDKRAEYLIKMGAAVKAKEIEIKKPVPVRTGLVKGKAKPKRKRSRK